MSYNYYYPIYLFVSFIRDLSNVNLPSSHLSVATYNLFVLWPTYGCDCSVRWHKTVGWAVQHKFKQIVFFSYLKNSHQVFGNFDIFL